MKLFPAFLLCLLVSTAATVAAQAQWRVAQTDSTASFRGIHSAGRRVVWASGTHGTVLRSMNQGHTWQQCTVPPGAAKLDFRGVFGWDGSHAIVLSSGTGPDSRLYATEDGCASWQLLFQNPDPDGFWDTVAFRGNAGVLLGDPVKGRFILYRSNDAGHHWTRDADAGPTAAAKEGAFAASNSSLVLLPNLDVLIGTGGIGGPRVLRLAQGSWSVARVPLAAAKETSGVFSLAFRDGAHGIAVGGDYKDPSQSAGTAAWTADGGKSWHAAGVFPSGYRSSVQWDPQWRAWITVGSNGGDLSTDDGRSWRRFDLAPWNALSLPWVAGPDGRIASLDRQNPALLKALRNASAKRVSARP